MNKKLSDAATRAVTVKGYETQPHLCERFVRQVCQKVYGSEFDAQWKASAAATGQAFQEDGQFVVPLTAGSVPGDLLFKLQGSGGDGHVGIRVLGNRVAENSSVHWNSQAPHPDARGFRSLKEFGHYDLIVRLPLA